MQTFQNYKNKVVRDLAWIIASPPLLNNINHLQLFFDHSYYKNEYNKFADRLDDLDGNPQELVDHIDERNTHLLGKYFESLVEYWLTKSEDKELLAHNLQVFQGRNTIGEFDFVYRDLTDEKVYHLECAGKFYISHKNSNELSNFIGPNSVDNLERKVKKIVNDQISLGETEAGKEALFIEGIEKEVTPKILLKGYLFYYADLFFNEIITIPQNAEPDHPKGWWIHKKDIDYFFSRHNSKWIIIERMNWISKVFELNQKKILSNNEIISRLKKYFADNTYPLLIAEVAQNKNEEYEEVSRGFVVHDTWPGINF